MGLTALVPTNEMGLTTLGNPTFWVYLPETTATQLVLSVMEQGKDKSIIHHSQTSFPILPKSGLMSLKLPAQSPPLEVGKTYKWAVIILCGNSPHPSDPVIEAWVRRVDLSIPNPSMNSAKKASWYGEQGIWFDFLDSLAKARQAEPDNKVLKTDWVDTLKSIKLETLDSKSF